MSDIFKFKAELVSLESKKLLLEAAQEKAETIGEWCDEHGGDAIMRKVKRVETMYYGCQNEIKCKVDTEEEKVNRWKEFDKTVEVVIKKLKDFEVVLSSKSTESNNLEDVSRTLSDVEVIVLHI